MSESGGPAFALPDGVSTRMVEGEMVLLNLRSEQYYGLDRVGADIVTRLTTVPFPEAMDALCRDYDVEDDVLRADVERLTGELLQEGLLERADLPQQ